MQVSLQEKKLTSPELAYTSRTELENCHICGEPIGKVVRMLGRNYVVPRMCKCKRKALEENKKVSEAKEKQIRLERIFKLFGH